MLFCNTKQNSQRAAGSPSMRGAVQNEAGFARRTI
jgi:hypothetical protein